MKSIHGRVLDQHTARGAPYALIQLRQNGTLIATTRADDEGDFCLDVDPSSINGALTLVGQDGSQGRAKRPSDGDELDLRDRRLGTLDLLAGRAQTLVIVGKAPGSQVGAGVFLGVLITGLLWILSYYLFLHTRCPNSGVPYSEPLSAVIDTIYAENWHQIPAPRPPRADLVCRPEPRYGRYLREFFIGVSPDAPRPGVVDPETVSDAPSSRPDVHAPAEPTPASAEPPTTQYPANEDTLQASSTDQVESSGAEASGTDGESEQPEGSSGSGEPAETDDDASTEDVKGGPEPSAAPPVAPSDAATDAAAGLMRARELFESLTDAGGDRAMSAAEVDAVLLLFERSGPMLRKGQHLRAEPELASLRRQLRRPPSYFWELDAWRLGETFLWALIATLVRLILNTGNYIWTRRFVPSAIASHVALIVAVPILALLISFVAAMIDLRMEIGSTTAIDLGDIRTSILIAAFIGFAPWKAWEFLAAIGDRFFQQMRDLLGAKPKATPDGGSDDAAAERDGGAPTRDASPRGATVADAGTATSVEPDPSTATGTAPAEAAEPEEADDRDSGGGADATREGGAGAPTKET